MHVFPDDAQFIEVAACGAGFTGQAGQRLAIKDIIPPQIRLTGFNGSDHLFQHVCYPQNAR